MSLQTLRVNLFYVVIFLGEQKTTATDDSSFAT